VYTAELVKALRGFGVDVAMWFAARHADEVRARLRADLLALKPKVSLMSSRVPNVLLYSPRALAVWRRWPRWLPPPRVLPRGLDLYHAQYWPLPLDRGVPEVLTIHDMIALRHPEWCIPDQEVVHRSIQALAPRFAHVMTDSEATRRDVLELTGIEPERVTTVPLGVNQARLREVGEDERAAVRERYGLSRPYVLSLATREPRKNLGRLVDAYDLLCERSGAHWDLAVVGAKGWGEDEVIPQLSTPRKGRVVVADFIPNEHLPPMLACASAFCFVSMGEGFGLPPLEAMAVGCPVVTSNVSSLPEVVGDAALTVDPLEVGAIADALRRVLTEKALANDLRRRGRERARGFTWEKTARQTRAVYQRAAGGG